VITIALFVLSDVLTTKFLGQKNISSFLEATIFAMKAVISVITALAIVLMANYFTDSLSYNSLLNDIKNKTSKSPWRILNEEEYKEVSVKLIHKCFEINMIYFEQNFWEAFANFSQKDRKNSLYSFYISLLKEQPKNFLNRHFILTQTDIETQSSNYKTVMHMVDAMKKERREVLDDIKKEKQFEKIVICSEEQVIHNFKNIFDDKEANLLILANISFDKQEPYEVILGKFYNRNKNVEEKCPLKFRPLIFKFHRL